MDATVTQPQVVEVTGAGSPGFPGLLAVRQAIDAEVWPDDMPTPATELAALLFAPAPDRRKRAWLALAPDGSAAGASQLLVSRLRPSLGRQGDTGVVGAHRGHGLGRWLKAENLRRTLAHEPAVTVVEAFNAASNPHMLVINAELGFRPYRTFHTYQGSLAAALAAALAAVDPR